VGIVNPLHLAFVAVVALLVLGPKRLPELARSLGHGMREFRETIGQGLGAEQPTAPTYAEQPFTAAPTVDVVAPEPLPAPVAPPPPVPVAPLAADAAAPAALADPPLAAFAPSTEPLAAPLAPPPPVPVEPPAS
jgi:TatA/E family protein of Tat protein translocase